MTKKKLRLINSAKNTESLTQIFTIQNHLSHQSKEVKNNR